MFKNKKIKENEVHNNLPVKKNLEITLIMKIINE